MTPSDFPPSFSATAAPPSGDFAELVKTVRSLRILLNLTLAVLLLLVVLLNAFVLFQVRSMRREASLLGPAVQEMERLVGDYETNSVRVMQRFTLDLSRFAERNPDFAPILNRYTAALAVGRPTNTPPQTPQPPSAGSTPGRN